MKKGRWIVWLLIATLCLWVAARSRRDSDRQRAVRLVAGLPCIATIVGGKRLPPRTDACLVGGF